MKTTCISNFNSFPTCTSSGLPWCPVAGEVEPSLSTRLVPHPKYSLGGGKKPNIHEFHGISTCPSYKRHVLTLQIWAAAISPPAQHFPPATAGQKPPQPRLCYHSAPTSLLDERPGFEERGALTDFQMIFECDWKPRILPECCCCTAHPLAGRTGLDAGITPISQATSPTVRSTL